MEEHASHAACIKDAAAVFEAQVINLGRRHPEAQREVPRTGDE